MREARYDLRKVVPTTASILGTVGGFAVTAIVVVLTVAPSDNPPPDLLALASGLLALSLIGCLTGAFSLASLAAEKELTVNLTAAGMYMSVGPTIGVVATLTAFQVLASMYIPDSKGLFATMAMLVGVGGAVFNGFAPLDELDGANPDSDWIQSRGEAVAWTVRLSIIAAAPLLVGFMLYAAGLTVRLSTRWVTGFIAVGMLIAIACALAGVFRTVPPESGAPEHGLRRREAIALQAILGAFMGAMFVCLP